MIPVSGFFVVVAGKPVCDDSPRAVVECIGHRDGGFGLGSGDHFLPALGVYTIWMHPCPM